MSDSQSQNTMRPLTSASGFTLIEMLIVIAVIAIMTGIAVFSFSNTRNSYAADDAANMIVNYFRDASGRAIADHHSYRVVINLAAGKISLIDEKTSSGGGNNEGDTIGGDDVLVKWQPLIDRVSMSQPGQGTPQAIGPPPSPYNYPTAAFTSNEWTAHFQSDGTVTGLTSGVNGPMTCTLFFQSTDLKKVNTLTRAVTLFGPTSSVRYWLYDGSKFVQG